jgi:hypothetical protein
MGDNASANGFEGQLATWIHWWSSAASGCWPALALRLQQLVRDQPLGRCNIVVDVGRVRQLLLRIAADIEELEAQCPPPAGDPPQAGNVCCFELGTG